jgi:LacI family transcriptional regulator
MKNNKGERKSAPTMHEIARLAGVSQSTVSRVLNGNATVIPEKHAAVMEVVERLNFRPNVAAQGLVQGKTSAVGILTRHVASPFHAELLQGVTEGLRGSRYSPVMSLGGDTGNDDYVALDTLISRQVDALVILYSIQITDEYLQEAARRIPMIVIGRQVPGLENHCVGVDNRAGAYKATSYLISKGHTRIAHITGPADSDDANARRDGYLHALYHHGIEVDPELIIDGDYSEACGILAVDRLLSIRDRHPFSAIFVANDQSALGVRLALFHRQINVPGDISMMGFDDISGAQYMTPPLTTIRQPLYLMGLMAAKAVLALLANTYFVLPEFPTELIERQSVAILSNNINSADHRLG